MGAPGGNFKYADLHFRNGINEIYVAWSGEQDHHK